MRLNGAAGCRQMPITRLIHINPRPIEKLANVRARGWNLVEAYQTIIILPSNNSLGLRIFRRTGRVGRPYVCLLL
jgi:hypothetical protein